MNTPAWEQVRKQVTAAWPSAFCCCVEDRGFKVYGLVGDCRVALSESWETETMAWHDAAARLKQREQIADMDFQLEDRR